MINQHIFLQKDDQMATFLNLKQSKTLIITLLSLIENRGSSSKFTDESTIETLKSIDLSESQSIDIFEDDLEDHITLSDGFTHAQINEKLWDSIQDFRFGQGESIDDNVFTSIEKAKNVDEVKAILQSLRDHMQSEFSSYIDNYEVDTDDAEVHLAKFDDLVEVRDALESISYSAGGRLSGSIDRTLALIEETLEILEKAVNFDNDKDYIVERVIEDINDQFRILDKILDNTNELDINSISRDDWTLIKMFLDNKDKIMNLLKMIDNA